MSTTVHLRASHLGPHAWLRRYRREVWADLIVLFRQDDPEQLPSRIYCAMAEQTLHYDGAAAKATGHAATLAEELATFLTATRAAATPTRRTDEVSMNANRAAVWGGEGEQTAAEPTAYWSALAAANGVTA